MVSTGPRGTRAARGKLCPPLWARRAPLPARMEPDWLGPGAAAGGSSVAMAAASAGAAPRGRLGGAPARPGPARPGPAAVRAAALGSGLPAGWAGPGPRTRGGGPAWEGAGGGRPGRRRSGPAGGESVSDGAPAVRGAVGAWRQGRGVREPEPPPAFLPRRSASETRAGAGQRPSRRDVSRARCPSRAAGGGLREKPAPWHNSPGK